MLFYLLIQLLLHALIRLLTLGYYIMLIPVDHWESFRTKYKE